MDCKVCIDCKAELPLSAYSPNAWAHDKHQSRCRPCHAAASSKRARKRRAALTRLKAERGCKFCGDRSPARLLFHHRNDEEKIFEVGTRVLRSLKAIEAEIAKCDVVCVRCHRFIHRMRKAAEVLGVQSPV